MQSYQSYTSSTLTKSVYTRNYNGFKRLIARRGRASVIYSGNEKAFVAASKWIIKIKNDEEMQEYLIQVQIKRKFNLSKAPWWEGQFERMIGLVKQSLFTAIGRAMLI